MSRASDATAGDAASDLLVACLCAGWCLTCTAYQATFAALAQAHPGVRFAWVDIEDQADALEEAGGGEPPDVENFPTLLMGRAGQPLFLGTVLPHAAVAERLLAEAAQGRMPALRDPGSARLVRAVDRLQADGALALPTG